MCLTYVAHAHFVTEAGEKSKPGLINFMGPGGSGPRPAYGAEGRWPRAEKNKYPQASKRKIKVTTWW